MASGRLCLAQVVDNIDGSDSTVRAAPSIPRAHLQTVSQADFLQSPSPKSSRFAASGEDPTAPHPPVLRIRFSRSCPAKQR